MKELERIADQLRRAFRGGAWHGAAVGEILRDVRARSAAARPLPAAHSIWEIVLHMTATHDLVHRRLAGADVQLTPEQDWPSVADATEAAWTDAVRELESSHARVLAALEGIDESRIDDPILPGYSSIYVTLHGLVQHDLYHAGQIAVLAKGAVDAPSRSC